MNYLVKYPHKDKLSPNAQVYLQIQDKSLLTKEVITEFKNAKYILNTPTFLEDEIDIDSIIWSSKAKGHTQELVDKCTEYIRSKFKSIGSGYIGDKNKVKDNLVWFFETYPEYANYETICSATDRYINITKQKKGMFRLSHYFIKKFDLGDRQTPISDLSTYCEEVDGLGTSEEITLNLGV